ncbi:MAG: ABC transporter ATP-binding protein [Oligoflexales bacterium]
MKETTNKKPSNAYEFWEDEIKIASSGLSAFVLLLRYSRPFKLGLAFALVLVLLSSMALMFSAKALGDLAQEFLRPEKNTTQIYTLAAIILFLETINVGLMYIGRINLAKITNQIAYKIRIDLFEKITKLPIPYFDRQPLGRTITRLTSDIEGIEKFFTGPLARIVNAFITIFTVILAMLFTDVGVGLIVIASCLPAVAITILTKKPVIHWVREHKIRSSTLNAKTAEYINGFPLIKIFGLESWSFRSYDKLNDDVRNAGICITNWNSFIRPSAAFLCGLPVALILWVGGTKVLAGALTVGIVVAFVRYAERILRPVMQISQEVHVIQEAIASSERVQKMLSESEELQYLGPSGKYRARLQGHVEFDEVHMAYNEDAPVLKGISFEIAPGASVGLVGETGSGKTSTINLIPQLYSKTRGRILFDGVATEDWDRQCLRTQIGMVGQDVIVFGGTLRENLIVARGAQKAPLTDRDLIRYAQQTGLSNILEKLPDGLNFQILDGGENLSVGEKQLIALTRMLIKDPQLFILDEATANIDPSCEELIQGAISTILKNRTCFIIAHRLNTILQCSQILVFKKGVIVEAGNHETLMGARGYYYQLACSQLGMPTDYTQSNYQANILASGASLQ